jgi:hypothetical protein
MYPVFFMKDDPGYLSSEKEGIDFEVLRLEFVARSSGKRGFWTDYWLAEGLLALLQIPTDSGLRGNRAYYKAGCCRQYYYCLAHRLFHPLDEAGWYNNKGPAGQPDGMEDSSMLDQVSDVVEWYYFDFHGFPLG